MRIQHQLETGITPYVHVPGGFLPLEPAIRPDSALRFHRGIAPQVPGDSTPTAARAGATSKVGPRADRPRNRSKGPAPALANTSPAAARHGTGELYGNPDVPGGRAPTGGAVGASVPAAPAQAEG